MSDLAFELAMQRKLSKRQIELLTALLAGPFSDVELTAMYDERNCSTCRTYRNKLTEMGLICDTGRKKYHGDTPGGRPRPHRLWELTDLGRARAVKESASTEP